LRGVIPKIGKKLNFTQHFEGLNFGQRGEPKMSAKDDFKKEAIKIKREGIGTLLAYLEETDFFTAPASAKYHGAEEGGLLLHSMSVLDTLKEMNEFFDLGMQEESLIVCGLFHDVCKVGFYVEDKEEASPAQVRKFQELSNTALPKGTNTKAYYIKVIDALIKGVPIPKFSASYRVKDQLPMGHGEKSIWMIERCMSLLNEEALAIRWHLGGFDPGIHFGYPSGLACTQAFRENKLVGLLASADLSVTYLADVWPEVV
jgi:hypothetical protein